MFTMIEPLSKKLMNTASPCGFIFLLLGILYFNILKDLVKDWWIDPNYSHGFLIPLVTGYLVWERREDLRRLEVKPCNWGILVLLFGILTLFIGTIGAELFTTRCSLIMVTAGLIIFMLGVGYFKLLFFPLAFLVFMIPLPYLIYDSVAFPLKLFAARVATFFLQLIEVPILREGNLITLPNTTLEVADACSGIRSLMSLIVLGIVYAYFIHRAFWKRVVLVAASVPVAICANASRLVITGILAHYGNPDLAQGFFHTFSGWVLFVIAFLMLFGIGMVLGSVSREK